MSLPLMKNYINGEWVESNSTTFGDVWNPAKGEKIAQVAYGTAEDVNKAVQAAKDAFWEWRTTPPLTRARYLFRIAICRIVSYHCFHRPHPPHTLAPISLSRLGAPRRSPWPTPRSHPSRESRPCLP